VIEIVNNWECASFIETYRPSSLENQLSHILHATQPDVMHVHNLLNLSFDLPAMAKARSTRVVATLHDYTLVCASGGQRIHRSEEHVCRTIDPERCARCFGESAFREQASFARVAGGAPSAVRKVAVAAARRYPTLARRTAAMMPAVRGPAVTAHDIVERMRAGTAVLSEMDLVVAPSQSLASEFVRFGLAPEKLDVSDNGFAPMAVSQRRGRDGRIRIGYVGTLVWHKGVHVLIDAVRALPPAEFELKIFGDPSVFPQYASDLRASAAGLPVDFMGPFENDRRAEVYEQIDVLVVPSLWLENSPLVIHEAFMAGVPVVGSRIGGTADLVTDGLNGLLYDPTSPAQLTAALASVIAQPDRLEMFRAQLPRVKSIDDDAAEWETRYQAVISRSPRAAAS
jgi:glycosyltransferase involved in cell wall biosynthesis